MEMIWEVFPESSLVLCRPKEYPGSLFQITRGVELVHSLQACLRDIKVPDVAGPY